jgi:hypothetical protein
MASASVDAITTLEGCDSPIVRLPGASTHRTEVDDLCANQRSVAAITWRAYSAITRAGTRETLLDTASCVVDMSLNSVRAGVSNSKNSSDKGIRGGSASETLFRSHVLDAAESPQIARVSYVVDTPSADGVIRRYA